MDDELVKLPGSLLTVVFARADDGKCPAEEYWLSLAPQAQARFLYLFKHRASNPMPLRGQFDKKLDGTEFSINVTVHGSRKKKKVSKILHEFKSNTDKARMTYFYWHCRSPVEEKFIVITHGFPKKEDKIKPGEITRAQNIAKAYIRRKAKKGKIG